MAENTEQVGYLRRQFNDAVDRYVFELCLKWEISADNVYWVSDDKTGVLCFNDTDCLSLPDLIYVVDNNISYKEYAEWDEYNAKASEYNLTTINLKSWHMGCPRVEKSVFDRLDKLKKDFEDACNDARKEF